MKKNLLSILLFVVVLNPLAWAQTTETFESYTTGRPTSFTSGTYTFNCITNDCNNGGVLGVFIPSQSYSTCISPTVTNVGSGLGIGTSCTAGSCTGTSNNFLDNGTSSGTNQMYSIATSNNALFTVKSLFVYVSTNNGTAPASSGLILTGIKSGVPIYTITLSAGLNTNSAVNNGYTFIDFNSSGNATTSIDQLQIQGSNGVNYVAIDNFTWAAAAGEALNFDGANDYVNVPDNAALNFGTNDFTIEADFQSSVSQPNYAGIVVKAPNNGGINGGYQLVIVNNHIAAEISDGGSGFLGTGNGLEGTSTLTDGNWHHLAMVVNRANNNIKLLVDGTVEANVTDPSIATINVSNPTVDMLLGVERTFALYANGNIDEVRIWNRALCTSEIQNNMPGEVATNSNSLVVYYKFNQGFINSDNTAITTLTDATTNALSGTLNNMTLTGATSNFVAPGAVTTGSMVTAFSNTLSAVATQTNIACNGDASGIASVAVSGIESPFTYAWSSGGGTSSTQGSLLSGNYTCTINNSCGSITQTFTLTEPNKLSVTATAGTIVCGGSTTTVTVSATGGTTNYTGTGTFTVSSEPTPYTYTVTDANGCVASASITITQPAPLRITLDFNPIACNGGTTTVSVTATGGTPNYTGEGTYTATATSYTYIVSDANNCTSSVNISFSEPAPLQITTGYSPINCNGAATTVSVTATGGTAPYTNDGAFTNVTANSYTYTVTDANACSATTTVTVTQPNAISSTQSPTLCAGRQLIVGTHTYTTAGTYTDVLTAQNGCDSTVTTNLAFYSVINAAVTVNSTTITASNATATSYEWVNCSTGAPIAGATSQSFVATTNGNYAVIVSEGVCSRFSPCTLISTIGIAQYNAASNLQVYPNPFTNELTIVSTAKTNALLFDMLGNKINEFVLQNTTQTISLESLAPGMYYLQVDNSKIKIIKQ
jgi:hypothetical protein